jgi:hypothetical protein
LQLISLSVATEVQLLDIVRMCSKNAKSPAFFNLACFKLQIIL